MVLEWKPCHAWHRFGKDVDINRPPIAHRARVRQLAAGVGLNFVHGIGKSHWHFNVN